MFKAKELVSIAVVLVMIMVVLATVPSDVDAQDSIAGIDTDVPYYSITIGDSIQYYQAETVTISISNLNYSETFYALDTTDTNEYGDATTTILDKSEWTGAELRIFIPEGTTLHGFGQKTMGSFTDFSSIFSKIEINGPGTFKPVIPNMSSDGKGNVNDYTGAAALGFNGVETTLNDVVVDASGVYGGSTYVDSKLESTSLTLNGVTLVKSSVYGGSVRGDVGVTTITINGVTSSDSSTKYFYGGNKSEGDVGETNIIINDASCLGNLYVVDGGTETSKVATTNVTMNGGICSYLFGGAGSENSEVEESNVILNNGTCTVNVFGGGLNSGYTKTTNVEINGGLVGSCVYGGTFNGKTDTASILVTGGTVSRGVIAGGYGSNAEQGIVNESTILMTSGSVGVIDDDKLGIFAGGETAPTGHVSIRVDGGFAYAITDGTADSDSEFQPCTDLAVSIEGGIFGTDVSRYVTNGYVIDNGDGTFTVSDQPPFFPSWDDDDDYVPPIVPAQPSDSGDDNTVTVVACAAAAVVAALMAAFLILDRKR